MDVLGKYFSEKGIVDLIDQYSRPRFTAEILERSQWQTQLVIVRDSISGEIIQRIDTGRPIHSEPHVVIIDESLYIGQNHDNFVQYYKFNEREKFVRAKGFNFLSTDNPMYNNLMSVEHSFLCFTSSNGDKAYYDIKTSEFLMLLTPEMNKKFFG